jgi:hypothetical protein
MPFNTPFPEPLELETEELAKQNLAFVTELWKRLSKELEKMELLEQKESGGEES